LTLAICDYIVLEALHASAVFKLEFCYLYDRPGYGCDFTYYFSPLQLYRYNAEEKELAGQPEKARFKFFCSLISYRA
jgi:hypothetical protein